MPTPPPIDRVAVTAPSRPGDLAFTLQRNIDTLQARRIADESQASRSDRVARAVTDFAGSIPFVIIHVLLFGSWIAMNTIGSWRFDPSLVILAMVASVEAIFLSTFVLISQNRNAAAEAKRAELDLQINLSAEHEITRLIGLVIRIADKLEVATDDHELRELERDVAADAVLDVIEASGSNVKARL